MLYKNNRGFTLIELLVVIAIIGILSSVVLASLNTAREKSRDAARVSDVRQIQLALELFFDSNGEYPIALTELETGGFMPDLPTDPVGGGNYLYAAYIVDTGVAPVAGNTCDQAAETCVFYHMGANLEQSDHSVLASDKDYVVAGVIEGDDADGCTAADANRFCYDLTP